MALPAFMNLHRRTIRAPVNPLDRATIVSIYPQEIDEKKHTIQPGRFVVPAGRYDNPSILVVGPSSWWREIDEDQPLLEIPVSSIQIADSVIVDYCNGLLGCDMGEARPGLFFINGEKNLDQVKKEYKPLMDLAKKRQDNWFRNLVKIADILWARSNGNPLSISDQARMAAQELQLQDKPWLKDFSTFEKVNCPACGQLRITDYPICQHCHVIIDKKKFDELGLKFAS